VSATGTYREFFISADTCKSWKAFSNFPGKNIFDCCFSGEDLYVATESGLFRQSLIGLVPVSVHKENDEVQEKLTFAPTISLKTGMCRIFYYGADEKLPRVATFNLAGKRLPIKFQWSRSTDGMICLSCRNSFQKGVYIIKINDSINRTCFAKLIVIK
jgi:hypothetical protein